MKVRYKMNLDDLIHEIQIRPDIWNPQSPMYPNKAARKRAWREVVDVFNPDGCPEEKKLLETILQKKWKNTRDHYQKTLRAVQKGLPDQSPCTYAEQMSFMAPHLGKIKGPNKPIYQEPQNEVITPAAVMSPPPPPEEFNRVEAKFIKGVSSRREAKEPEDHDRMFLISLLQNFKNIPEDQKILAKIDILKVLSNYTKKVNDDSEF